MSAATPRRRAEETPDEPTHRVGIVVALVSEARALAPELSARPGRPDPIQSFAGAALTVSGMGAVRAAAGARRLVEAGATALASVGTAGALDPGLESGAIVLPQEVVTIEGGSVATDLRWREALAAALPRARLSAGRLLSTGMPIALRLDKAIARRETDGVAVDMESAAIAGVAAETGLPFVAVRVIVDTAADDLPSAVLAASRAGQVSGVRLLAALARAPWEIVALIRLAGRFRTACRVLAGIGEPGLAARRALTEVDREAEH